MLAVQLLAVPPIDSELPASPRKSSPTDLRAAVRSALRREAKANGPERIVVLKELIALHQQLGLHRQMQPGARRQLQGIVGGRLQRAAKDLDSGAELVDLIERTIAPSSWERQGGVGRIHYWRNGRALVITQTQQAHEGVADLFQQLQRAGN
jgi:hypothetical protein